MKVRHFKSVPEVGLGQVGVTSEPVQLVGQARTELQVLLLILKDHTHVAVYHGGQLLGGAAELLP